jgi:hypothetical protein
MNDATATLEAIQPLEATETTDRRAVVEFTRNKQTGEYVSVCGRFRIHHDSAATIKRGRWFVVDTSKRDPICPQYGMHIVRNHTLRSCMSQANRWARGFAI